MAFGIPPASLGFWIERLLAQAVKHEGPTRRFDEQVLTLTDPDGAEVTLHWSNAAHGLTREDLDAGERWMEPFGLSSLT